MNTFWLKIWIWIRVAFLGLVTVYLFTFVVENHSKEANFWYFPGQTINTSSLALAFFAFFAGVVATVLIRTSIKTLRQMRDAREQKAQHALDAERIKAMTLRTRTESERGDSFGKT